jgi:hypothetical protein
LGRAGTEYSVEISEQTAHGEAHRRPAEQIQSRGIGPVHLSIDP